MATYVYSDSDREIIVEKQFPMGEAPRSFIDEKSGRMVCRDIGLEHAGTMFTHSSSGWPRKSMAFGVNADQVKEAMALDKKLGVRVEYTDKGKAIFDSPGHERQVLRAHGFSNHTQVTGGEY